VQFTPRQALAAILEWPPATRYWVAFSGGVDSRVLLESLAAHAGDLPGGLAAIHVDHGLHPRSGEWARHCGDVCSRLGVPLAQERVEATPPRGSSPEAWARKLRYDAFQARIGPGEMLLTAHHLDDQAETVLLQLVRGGGPAGLAGMPTLRGFGTGHHGRPLLAFPRAELQGWAESERFDWIEDESNADCRFDRNFLRSEILPRLMTRWPALPSVLARTAELQAQAARILADVAASDLRSCVKGTALDIDALLRLQPERRANAVREWLRSAGLPLPGAMQMRLLEEEVIAAGRDRVPCLRWPGGELRRYRGRLYAGVPGKERDPRERIRWRLGEPLSLQHGVLIAETAGGDGIRAECCSGNEVEVRFRIGGERIRPVGSRHHRELRTLFQERGVPPWVRDRIPLVYVDGKLAAVPGLWIDSEFSAEASVAGWRFRWMESPATGDELAP
jgi:tRNA(Ile)-lysidine synthase